MRKIFIPARCLGVRFVPAIRKRVEINEPFRILRKQYPFYAMVYDRCDGTAQVVATDQLVIDAVLDSGGGVRPVTVGSFFKNNLGRLTDRRICAIRTALPKRIQLYRAFPGGSVMSVKDEDLLSWLGRAESQL